MTKSSHGWTLFAPIGIEFKYSDVNTKKKRLKAYVVHKEVIHIEAEIDLKQNSIEVLKSINIEEVGFDYETFSNIIKDQAAEFLAKYKINPDNYSNQIIKDSN